MPEISFSGNEVCECTFKNCESLATIIYTGEGPVAIGDHAFYSCENLTVIPFTVLSIDEYAFAYCSKLESIEIVGSAISTNAFNRCRRLTVRISDNPEIVRAIQATGIDYTIVNAGADQTEPAPEPSENQWVCENCGRNAIGNFCSNCGSPRPDPNHIIPGAIEVDAAPPETPAPISTPSTTMLSTPVPSETPSPEQSTLPAPANINHYDSFEDQVFIEAELHTQNEWRSIFADHYGGEPTSFSLNGEQCEAWIVEENSTILGLPLYVTILITSTPEGPSVFFMPRAQAYDSSDRNGVEAAVNRSLLLYKTADEYAGLTGSVATTGNNQNRNADQFISSIADQAMSGSAMLQWTAGNRYITTMLYPSYSMMIVGIKTN